VRVVFDLDGTLADTRDLVLRAYESVGIKMPNKAWGAAAEEWLEKYVGKPHVAETHRMKNVAYRALIAAQGLRELPACHLCRTLSRDDEYEVSILTGASYVAAEAVRAALKLRHVPFLGVAMKHEDKLRILSSGEAGIYFDDDYEAAVSVANATDWVVSYVSENTDLDTLLKGFKESEELCRQSS
jgi:phosphoglycolate phosphatase-like HAD superfamily hydrolase